MGVVAEEAQRVGADSRMIAQDPIGVELLRGAKSPGISIVHPL